MSHHTLIIPFFFLYLTTLQAQNISYRIIDKKTNQPIPYATIQLSNDKGIITNEEGQFRITMDQQLSLSDSIHISSMGYEKIVIGLKSLQDSIIYITPQAIELAGVYISNRNLTMDEIIENVKSRLDQNYNKELSHKKIFFRQSDHNNFNKFNVDFKKSTIEEFNKKFIDSVITILPKESAYYTETLCDFYGNFEKQKLNIIKGAELYDKSNDGSMDALSNKVEGILKKNIKPNSYLKIKSGWILSTKVQMDSIFENDKETTAIKEDLEKPDKEEETYFLKSRKNRLQDLFSSMFFMEDVKLNFIEKSGKYNFELIDYTTMDDSSVYIINFTPKRGADYKGTLYVNTEDFAIIRVDYENIKTLKSIKLLGISYKDYLYKGKTIFVKGLNGKYSLKYMEKTRGNLFGLKRPLKIIEKNKFVKGKRKQNELSLGLDISVVQVTKNEVVVFDTKPLTENEYNSSQENKTVKPKYLSKYDPEFWKGYNIIEPNTAIKQFTAEERS